MAELRVLREAVVGEHEVDLYGRMDVRCYLDEALSATRVLAALMQHDHRQGD